MFQATHDRLSKLKISSSNRSTLNRTSIVGENHDVLLHKMKESISQGETKPCDNISYDNIDIRRERKHISMKDQNLYLHWVNHRLTFNRVAGDHLST